MTVLPTRSKWYKEMTKTILEACQKALDPPCTNKGAGGGALGKTVAEARLQSQEKARLLAPTTGQQQRELLGPMIERELDLPDQMGWLPPIRSVLKEAARLVDADYTRPIHKAQRCEEGLAVVRTIEGATTLMQVDQTILFNFDGGPLRQHRPRSTGCPRNSLRLVGAALPSQ